MFKDRRDIFRLHATSVVVHRLLIDSCENNEEYMFCPDSGTTLNYSNPENREGPFIECIRAR